MVILKQKVKPRLPFYFSSMRLSSGSRVYKEKKEFWKLFKAKDLRNVLYIFKARDLRNVLYIF